MELSDEEDEDEVEIKVKKDPNRPDKDTLYMGDVKNDKEYITQTRNAR